MSDTLRRHHCVSFLEPERVTAIGSTEFAANWAEPVVTTAGELHPGNLDILRVGELAERGAECEQRTRAPASPHTS